jgi:hypothetical protein
MLQIQGIEAAAVVIYRNALITREMRHHRVSRRVNNTVKKTIIENNRAIYILIKAKKSRQSFCIKPAIKYTNNVFLHVIPAKAGIQEIQ